MKLRKPAALRLRRKLRLRRPSRFLCSPRRSRRRLRRARLPRSKGFCYNFDVRLALMRSWRNWQTHQLEGLAVAIPWWFESTRPHHRFRPGSDVPSERSEPRDRSSPWFPAMSFESCLRVGAAICSFARTAPTIVESHQTSPSGFDTTPAERVRITPRALSLFRWFGMNRNATAIPRPNVRNKLSAGAMTKRRNWHEARHGLKGSDIE